VGSFTSVGEFYMNGIGRYGSVIEIDALKFMGSYATSPLGLLTVAYGDRANAANPSEKWLVVLRGDTVIHQEKLSASITRAQISDSGLVVLDLFNRTSGAASFAVLHADGRTLVKARGALNFDTMLITPDEQWLIYEDGDSIRAVSLEQGKVMKKKALPPARLDALRLAGVDTAEAVMFGGDVVSLKFR
jgi:hypothetical protein